MQYVYLGIDTSCYTASVAVISAEGKLLEDVRRVLDVKHGKCGLKQSEMVFQHMRNLPELLETALRDKGYRLLGVGVSSFPRSVKGSYMPVFLAGLGIARALAVATASKLYMLSHQENHLVAGFFSVKGFRAEKFLMLHASGGTTDLLFVNTEDDGKYLLTQVGGSVDLHAGQFIDRIGVAIGLKFPVGSEFEKIAECAEKKIELPISVNGTNISLSGPATSAMRKLHSCDVGALALGTEYVIAESFARMLANAIDEYEVADVLMVGGVSGNNFIRKHVIARLAEKNVHCWVPEVRFSSDNAVGCAAYARYIGEG
ncbi:MAG: O-sialoglycoprotein endopeptidase [Phascolarctobacterium sp.]|nr:O-sialoglycoprotein endopeptidase [Phascolarctobacterium sp.]